jgi:predicted metal-dependent peptidase
MASKKTDINTEISRCINQLLLKEPFYAHILAGTVREVTTNIPTAAVGFNNELILLMVNETFFLNELKSVSERVAVLKHETLHLVFRHLFRDKIKEDSELFNIAADLVVNQYIGAWKLPDNAVTLKAFPDLNLKPEQTLEYYYDILMKLKQAIDKSTFMGGNGDESGNGQSENTEPTMDEKHPKSAEAFKNIYRSKRHSDHSKWVIKDGSNATTADGQCINDNVISGLEQSLGKQILDAAARTPSKFYGSLPGALTTQIDIIRASMTPKVDWRRALKIFSSANGRSMVYHTMKRISKRFGTRPGIRIVRFKKLVVVIDTSGSLDESSLAQFFKEIDTIHKNGAEVMVIECDAKVHNFYKYNRTTPIKVMGGGGTNYDPAFEFINKNRRMNFDACIYLTDGYAPAPTIRPRCNLLYVITPGGQTGGHLKWGRFIKMK